MININNIKMVSPAFTAKTRVADNLLVYKSINLAKLGDVIVIDAEERYKSCYFRRNYGL